LLLPTVLFYAIFLFLFSIAPGGLSLSFSTTIFSKFSNISSRNVPRGIKGKCYDSQPSGSNKKKNTENRKQMAVYKKKKRGFFGAFFHYQSKYIKRRKSGSRNEYKKTEFYPHIFLFFIFLMEMLTFYELLLCLVATTTTERERKKTAIYKQNRGKKLKEVKRTFCVFLLFCFLPVFISFSTWGDIFLLTT
jgi:hypothetical protein